MKDSANQLISTEQQSVFHPCKIIVLVPTYNEREVIEPFCNAVRQSLPDADILVLDDGSPDGTGTIVEGLAAADPKIKIRHRPKKLGLGRAYIDGFQIALSDDYDCMICMDCDFSHDPAALPKLVEAIGKSDLVIGSRYIPGGSTPDWKFHRRLLSRMGNLTARFFLSLSVHDCTAGFRCWRRSTLEKLNFDSIKLTGYGFQIETTYQTHLAGMQIKEVPITFNDRRLGASKMHGGIIKEALFYVVMLRLRRIRSLITKQY